MQEELKYEKKEKKYLMDEIENLKKELQKSKKSTFFWHFSVFKWTVYYKENLKT